MLRCKLPIGPKGVLFWGSYIEFHKVIPKKELLWDLYMNPKKELLWGLCLDEEVWG